MQIIADLCINFMCIYPSTYPSDRPMEELIQYGICNINTYIYIYIIIYIVYVSA